MPAKIHYEDNLFFLHSILRTIEAGLRLDIDPELYRDKILEDVFFVDAMVMRVFVSLRENERLINRTGYLRSLRRTVTAYSAFLDRLLVGPTVFGGAFAPYRDKLESARQEHQALRREIDALLDKEEPDEETWNTVSSEEYSYLLAGDPRSEEDADTPDDTQSDEKTDDFTARHP